MKRSAALLVSLSALAFLVSIPASGMAAGGKGYARTTSGLKKARWAKRMTVNYSKSAVRLRSDGIPNHSRPAYYAVPNAGVVVPGPDTAQVAVDPTTTQNYDYSLPVKPRWSSTTTAAPLGSIGMMVSGSVLFNPYEGDGTTVAMASNFSIDAPDGSAAPFVDDCSGHPTPAMNGRGGQYHYHALPACITARVDKSNGPSHIIGIAFDGYPIYGARNIRGRRVKVSSLDKCNGIRSATPEFPKGIYHYVLPGTADATSSIRCFHGKVDSGLIQQMPPMGPPGGPPAARASSTASSWKALCHLPALAN